MFAGIPDHGLLYASSSMPIRDVDAFGGHRGDGSSVTVLANRGANGIDGVISSALGAAAYGAPVTALVGDVAALHDLNALATTVRLDLPVTVVVVHNDGGGIFSFLPQADPTRFDPDVFERHLGTPHGTDFGAVATALGMKVGAGRHRRRSGPAGRRRLRPDPGRVPHRPDRERRRARPLGERVRAAIDRPGSLRLVSNLLDVCIDCSDPWTLAQWWAPVLDYRGSPAHSRRSRTIACRRARRA